MKYCLKSQNNKNLIVFFCGWGMDETPMLPLTSDSDVLYIYDYNDLNFEFDFSKYEDIKLIAFSCGVYMASLAKDSFPHFSTKIAINGTLKPFDEDFGITKEMAATFEGISLENCLEFREKLLVENKQELQLFNQNSPKRTLESSLSEFEALKKYSKIKINEHIKYDKILISQNDRIIPTEAQKAFWQDNFKTIPGAHFPFYNFKSLEDIINI